MKKPFLSLVGLTALGLWGAPAALAQDAWDFRLTPYLWAMGIDGDIHIRNRDFQASSDFADIVDNMDIGGSAIFEASKGNWVNFAQLDYLSISSGDIDLRNSPADAELKSSSFLGSVATGYRFRTGERSTIDLMVGVRHASLEPEISVQGLGKFEGKSSVTDAMVMLRPRFAITMNWYFSPTMSVGAGDSDLVWELSPQFYLDRCGIEYRFGYRNLNYDLKEGGRSMDITISGPMIGVGFAF